MQRWVQCWAVRLWVREGLVYPSKKALQAFPPRREGMADYGSGCYFFNDSPPFSHWRKQCVAVHELRFPCWNTAPACFCRCSADTAHMRPVSQPVYAVQLSSARTEVSLPVIPNSVEKAIAMMHHGDHSSPHLGVSHQASWENEVSTSPAVNRIKQTEIQHKLFQTGGREKTNKTTVAFPARFIIYVEESQCTSAANMKIFILATLPTLWHQLWKTCSRCPTIWSTVQHKGQGFGDA